MTYQLTTIQVNGAICFRSSREQDARVDAREMLAAVRAKFPTARFGMAFRTFDGDTITQFFASPANILDNLPHFVHGETLTF